MIELLTEINQVTTWQLALLTAVSFFFGVFMQTTLPIWTKKIEKWVKEHGKE